MSGTWPKIVRDPVHDIVTFEENECDRLLLDLINTPRISAAPPH